MTSLNVLPEARTSSLLQLRANAVLELRRRKRALTAANFQSWLNEVNPSWHWEWKHLVYIRKHLDRITSGEIKRLMLFMPPRSGKSEMTTIRYPVWRLEREPSLRVIIGAYNQLLANKFSRKARRIAEHRMTLAADRVAVEDWETAQGGGFRAVGVGSGITGQGGSLIIIDDPVKSREEAQSDAYRERVWDWYTDDLYTRLEPGGAIVLIMTRWAEDDLAGRILASEDGPSWTVVSLPAEAEENDPLGRLVGEALCPERFDLDALAEIRRVLGLEAYYALYQQRPQPETGTIFQRDWFPRGNAIERNAATHVIQAWDTAYTEGENADYSACVTLGMHSNGVFVLSAWRGRLDFPGLLRAMKTQFVEWRPDVVLVEDKGSGISAVQSLRTQTLLPIIGVAATTNKAARAMQVTGLCEAKRVIIPPTEWGEELLNELMGFPTGKHDDMVDAFVYALQRAIMVSADAVSIVPY